MKSRFRMKRSFYRHLVPSAFLLLVALLPSPRFAGSPWTIPAGTWKEKEGSLIIRFGTFNRIFTARDSLENPLELEAEVLGSVRSEYWIRVHVSEPPEEQKGTDQEESTREEEKSRDQTISDPLLQDFIQARQLILLFERGKLTLYLFSESGEFRTLTLQPYRGS